MPMMPPPMPPPMPGSHPGPRPFPFPFFQRQYIIAQPQTCRPVYNNQATLDALNGLLANCDSLRSQGVTTCNQAFKDSVQKELTNQLNKAVYIGNNCSTNNVYPTYRTIY